jgi:hypothetical protein
MGLSLKCKDLSNLLLTPIDFVLKFMQRVKLKIRVPTYFVGVIGRAILKKNQRNWLNCLSNEIACLLEIKGPKRSDTL